MKIYQETDTRRKFCKNKNAKSSHLHLCQKEPAKKENTCNFLK